MWEESSFKPKNEEIKSPEGELIKPSRPNIDLSGKEVLTEREKLLRLAEEMLAKEKEVSLEEKTEIIKDYIGRNYFYFEIDSTKTPKETTMPPFLFSKEISEILIEEKEENLKKPKIIKKTYPKESYLSKKLRDFFLWLTPPKTKEEKREILTKRLRGSFLRLTPEKLESTFGKEELNVVFRVISEYNDLLKQMEKNNLNEDIRKFIIKQNGHEMLPYRIFQILFKLEMVSIQLRRWFLIQWRMSRKEYKKSKKEFVQPLKRSFLNLKRENKRWQERSKPETEEEEEEEEEEEKPIEIQRFEEFDFPGIKGKEIIAKALEIPPKEFSATIESIEFKKEIPPADKSYNLLKTIIAGFPHSQTQKAKHKIKLYPTVPLEEFDRKQRINYLREIPSVLIQKWAYSLDPRGEIDQKDLTLQEQLKMIMDWEEIRIREKEWSEVVLTIYNSDKERERLLRSKRSFVESVTYFLNNPTEFQKICPKRFEFIANLFKKRFPKFDLEKSFKAKEEYDALINTLEQTSE